jgi:Flp pilus assembly protein TadG
MVEFALVVPVLVVLLAGILDFGLFFNDVISVRQGARDGVRNVAVGKFGTTTSCSLTGSLTTTQQKVICLVKGRDDVKDSETRVALVVGEAGCSGVACYAVGKPVTICEQYKFRTITGVTGALFGKTVTTRTTLRVEIKNSAEPLSSGAEPAIGGGAISCPAPAAVG